MYNLFDCVFQNTPESFEVCEEIMKAADEKSSMLPARTLFFIAALALNQNRPELAVELTTQYARPNYITIRCIRLIAFAQLKRFDDIIAILNQSSIVDSANGNKFSYFSDTVS